MKFKINQIVYYMYNKKPHSSPVLARMDQGDLAPVYAVNTGIINENDVFASHEDLMASVSEAEVA